MSDEKKGCKSRMDQIEKNVNQIEANINGITTYCQEIYQHVKTSYSKIEDIWECTEKADDISSIKSDINREITRCFYEMSKKIENSVQAMFDKQTEDLQENLRDLFSTEQEQISFCKEDIRKICEEIGIELEGDNDMGKFLIFIKELFSKKSSEYEELDSTTKEKLKNLTNSLEESDRKKCELEDMLVTSKQEFEKKLEDEKSKYENEKTTLIDQHTKYSEQKQEEFGRKINELEGEITELKTNLDEAVNKFDIVNKENQENIQTIKTKEDEIKAKEDELASQKASFDEERKRLEEDRVNLNQKIKETETELGSTKNELADKITEVGSLSSELDKIRNSFKTYNDIYDLMLKCPSMKCAFDQMEISGSEQLSEKEMVKFITFFSFDYGFARVVYNALEKSKAEDKETVTVEEYELIAAVNRYYGGKALDDLGMKNDQSIDFKRVNMKDLEEPRRTDFYQADGLYVPALRRKDDGSIDKKAIVKAR